ncbi:MAG TPA: hypothetical protein VFG67_02825, partial [Oleiagrimonas sp.]|nr:hypothetical protein [Oleiagrimonas sp.]
STRNVADMISGPMPSPRITAMVLLMGTPQGGSRHAKSMTTAAHYIVIAMRHDGWVFMTPHFRGRC